MKIILKTRSFGLFLNICRTINGIIEGNPINQTAIFYYKKSTINLFLIIFGHYNFLKSKRNFKHYFADCKLFYITMRKS
jgi:hypothetical protein